MNNAEKFKEVFGVDIPPIRVYCTHGLNEDCKECDDFINCEAWLKAEYKESTTNDKLLKDIDIAINATTGGDGYSVGMRNGMRYVKSLIDGIEPVFDECEGQIWQM